MSDLPDFGRLSLGSPSQDVFQNQIPYQNQITHTPAPLSSQSSSSHQASGYNSYQSNYQQPQGHLSHPVATAFPRPENMSTPSKSIHSAPRTPDPAAMQGGAFAGMAFSNTLPRTPQGAGLGSMALGRTEGAAPDHGFTPKLDKLFNMAERYCYSHLNFPSAAKDSQLHPSIKERLMKAASRESAHQLGSTGSTRYFLMTKVILQWMIKHIFTPSLFMSFDFDADRRIAACKDHIFQDTPPLVKYQLLCEISKEIRQIRGHPNFLVFRDNLVRNQGNKLWAIVRPMMHQTTAMDWEDLRILMFEAYSVAGDMAARPYEWRFDFAEIGSLYTTSMVNRDPYVHGHDDEIVNRGLAVRLGFVPAVFLRDNSDGMVRVGQVTRQQVLLKS